ncbi:MAG: SGNH/GDSL hydrolase family protein [Planctomycetaceae bacterium]|nr:SGNH/GDSL hydrolase family protein [Planctomycetaceae bacterium]
MLKLLSQASQPRVLILGDSISIGYTPHVQKSLQQDALIVRPMLRHKAAENCAGTDKGIQEIDRWLSIGGGKWDVIHFNFGLHDLKRTDAQTGRNSNDPKDPYQSSPAEYENQLGEIVKQLKQSGATLIFATTTPVPLGVKPHRDPTDPVTYNRIAESIMQANDIQINDLYQFANPILADIQRPANVHFTPAGSARLGEQVADQIRAALGDR